MHEIQLEVETVAGRDSSTGKVDDSQLLWNVSRQLGVAGTVRGVSGCCPEQKRSELSAGQLEGNYWPTLNFE